MVQPQRKLAGLVEVIRKDIISSFQGDTELKAVGSWKQDERIFTENNIRIEIDVLASDHEKAEAYMAGMKRLLQKYLKQEKIYVTYAYSRFEFLLPEDFLKEMGQKIPDKLPELDQLTIDLYRTLAYEDKST